MSSWSRLRSTASQPTLAKPGLPVADARARGVQVGRGRLAVPGREGDFRLLALAQADQGRGDLVLAVENRLEAIAAAAAMPRATAARRCPDCAPRRAGRVSLAILDQHSAAVEQIDLGGPLDQVVDSREVVYGFKLTTWINARIGRLVGIEQLDHPVLLQNRAGPRPKINVNVTGSSSVVNWLSVSDESE